MFYFSSMARLELGRFREKIVRVLLDSLWKFCCFPYTKSGVFQGLKYFIQSKKKNIISLANIIYILQEAGLVSNRKENISQMNSEK